jgi:hypothetical protein
MNQQKEQVGELETWAIIEVMGHQRYAGFVRQVPMGGAVMIRVDVPALPEKQDKYTYYDYDRGGAAVEKTRTLPAVPTFTKFLGVAAIFAITPCTEEVARAAVERMRAVPAAELSMPPRRALPDSRAYDDEGSIAFDDNNDSQF